MGKPYSEDLRKRVVAAVETGGLTLVSLKCLDMCEDDFGFQYLGCEIGLRHAVSTVVIGLVRTGTSRSFFAPSARSIARSACDIASALVIAWPALFRVEADRPFPHVASPLRSRVPLADLCHNI
jgi:hypothetical protein